MERSGMESFPLFHSFHSLRMLDHRRLSVSWTERETDCYTWHDSDDRHTLVDAALSRALPKAPAPLSPETNLPARLRLFALCAVEAFPGAGGLLCGQRSCRTIGSKKIRSLLFQHGVYSRCHFSGYCNNSFFSSHFFRMALIDPAVEGSQFQIMGD